MTPAARLALARVLRSRRGHVLASLWVVVALAAALAERARSAPAAGHVLLGTLAPYALPLLVYVLVGATVAGRGLTHATRPLVALGARPARAAGATLSVGAAAGALAGGALAVLVTTLAHGASDPPLARDALTAAWVGAAAGAAYATWFSLGAALHGGGAGRPALLVLDWLLGGSTGVGALFTPRAHLASLLGGPPAFELSQRASGVWLVALAASYAAATVFASRRR